MAVHTYECMFLLDPNSYARDPAGMANKVQGLVENSGGKILASRLWNEQRLAYPVGGHRKGVYWLIYFELNGDDMPKLNRTCRLADYVLRFLPIRLDPRLGDAMVARAKGETTQGDGSDNGQEPAESPADAPKEVVKT